MRDEADVTAEGQDKGDDGSKTVAPSGKKKLILIAGIGLLLLLSIGGGVFWYFSSSDGDNDEQQEKAEIKPVFFFPLPQMVVNITGSGQSKRYLRVKITLELYEEEAMTKVSPLLPRVQDVLTVYLRELRVSDLEGSASIYRLRDELKKRVSLTVYPVKIKSLLFKELLVQ
ncbi:MAG: flagellar basal body-associated FliL family protein [Alphaproteobacteria bacterium]|nr:flagellar basal body-associated FliL family protein [Alphaproteobacteria bacterium]